MSKASNYARRRSTALSDGGAEYAAKRAEIIGIAAKIFKEKGFKAARFADIATASGLDRATIYYYVGSKEELFREAVEKVLDVNLAFTEEVFERSDLGPIEKLERFAVQLMESYSANYPYPYVYIQEQMHQVTTGDSVWAPEIERKTRLLEGMVMRLLREGMEAGALRRDLQVRIVANALFGMFNWSHRWYEPDNPISASAIARSFLTIFLDGMKTADVR